MKDNYARNVFILLMVSAVMVAFIIGMTSGIVIYEVCDKINEKHRTNLMILYEGDK